MTTKTLELTDMEDIIIDMLHKDDETMVIPEQFPKYIDRTKLTKALYGMVDKGILKIRDCDGLAFEYADKVSSDYGELVQDRIYLISTVERDVENHFRGMLGDSFGELTKEVYNFAVENVFETSGISDNEGYNDSDVSLACQRAIVYFLNN